MLVVFVKCQVNRCFLNYVLNIDNLTSAVLLKFDHAFDVCDGI